MWGQKFDIESLPVLHSAIHKHAKCAAGNIAHNILVRFTDAETEAWTGRWLKKVIRQIGPRTGLKPTVQGPHSTRLLQ